MFTNFPLYIVGGNNVNLLGRNWLSEVKLDQTILFNCCKQNLNNISKTKNISENLENLVKNYSEIFSRELGTVKGIKAKVKKQSHS